MPLDLGEYFATYPSPLTVSQAPGRTGLFPMPTALVNRQLASDRPMTMLALRLFHGLLYLGWNLAGAGERVLLCSTPALRKLIGRRRQESNFDINAAFALLASTQFDIPRRDNPARSVTTSIIQWYQHDQEQCMHYWRLADAVVDWCSGSGVSYGWLDVRKTSRLRTVAALRLYELAGTLAGRNRKPWVSDRLPQFGSFFEVAGKYDNDWSFQHRFLEPTIAAVNKIGGLNVRYEMGALANRRKATFCKLSIEAKHAEDTTPVAAHPISPRDLQLLPPALRAGSVGIRESGGRDDLQGYDIYFGYEEPVDDIGA
jgi:hypothetical protein